MACDTKEVRLSDLICECHSCVSLKKYVSEYLIYAIVTHIWLLLIELVQQQNCFSTSRSQVRVGYDFSMNLFSNWFWLFYLC